MARHPSHKPAGAGLTFSEQFTPKLMTVLAEGYGPRQLAADAFAGASVAIIALPLSMAIAIASGLPPANGLNAAIIGGFLVSLLGGSRFQIGGPAGAFIGLIALAVARHGVDGMLLATFLSGLMLTAAGFLRLGAYVRLIPYPVAVGFTAGIAVVIFASQIPDLLGLTIDAPAAHDVVGMLAASADAIETANAAAACVALATILVILGVRRAAPALPGILIAVALAGLVAALAGLPVETIGTRFGGAPSALPLPSAPSFSIEKILAVLPDAFGFALLGAVESLLSASVADGMTGRRHRSNSELVAQGIANLAVAFFGGMPVTGTIARTATNVRAGAHGPVAGMLHAVFLLGFLLAAAPLAAYIPLAALAGVLVVVAWNMIERGAILALMRSSRGDAAALAATFLLTVFRTLTEAIVAGVAIGALAFIQRMAQSTALKTAAPLIIPDVADGPPGGRAAYAPDKSPDGVAVYRITGALFFGSAASLGQALDRILEGEKTLVLDFSEAALVDSTGAIAIRSFADKARKRGVSLVVAGATQETQRMLAAAGLDETVVRFVAAATRADLREP